MGNQPKLKLKLPRTKMAKLLLPRRQFLVSLLQETWAKHEEIEADVEVVFVKETMICQLHREFLNDPTPTDIITFDLGEIPNQRKLASIVICHEVAQRNAQKYRTTFERETNRLIIHGVLHLLGYSDKTQPQRRRMRYHENKILKRLFDE